MQYPLYVHHSIEYITSQNTVVAAIAAAAAAAAKKEKKYTI
jgi:hypothetical protein